LEESASQGFFCDVKTRICETLALRKDFRMIGTTLKHFNRSMSVGENCTTIILKHILVMPLEDERSG
jgi:hypothetical protein